MSLEEIISRLEGIAETLCELPRYEAIRELGNLITELQEILSV